MWQEMIVYPAVAVAMAWVAWTFLLPAPLRRRLRTLRGAPAPARRPGCGGCSGRGGGCH